MALLQAARVLIDTHHMQHMKDDGKGACMFSPAASWDLRCLSLVLRPCTGAACGNRPGQKASYECQHEALPICRILRRPYARVDRKKLKRKLLSNCISSGVRFHNGKAKECHHGTRSSTLECRDGTQITASVVVDATGHARLLTKMDGRHDPGYQAAYGIKAGAAVTCSFLVADSCMPRTARRPHRNTTIELACCACLPWRVVHW